MCMFAYLQLNGTLIKAINSVIQYFNITYFPNNPILKQMIQKLHETADLRVATCTWQCARGSVIQR